MYHFSFHFSDTLELLDIKEAAQLLKDNSHDPEKNYLFKKLDETSGDVIQTIKNQQTFGQIESVTKKFFEQTTVKIKNHIKQSDNKMVNIHKLLLACEVYFYTVCYKELFSFLCAKNSCQDSSINCKMLTTLTLKNYDLRSDIKAALQGSKANLTMLTYLTNPRAKLDALGKHFLNF